MAMTLEEIRDLEAAWVGRAPPAHSDLFGWEPYDPEQFIELLAACLSRVPPGNRTFLDAGCGIGTKCVLAAQAGLEAYGFDLSPELLEEARELGVSCEQADARTFTRYGDYGLVYVNHPLISQERESDLERRLHSQIAPGALLMVVNAGCWPSGWERLAGSEAAWTGVFRKP